MISLQRTYLVLSISAIPVKRNYFISCLDDCSRKVASKWSESKRTIDVLDVLEEWIVINGKPKKVMRDNGKQFTSKIFKRSLEHNNVKD